VSAIWVRASEPLSVFLIGRERREIRENEKRERNQRNREEKNYNNERK
jgi:hypothetical protein